MGRHLMGFLGLAILAAVVAWIEVPSMLREGQKRELWAFIGVGVVAFTLLGLVSASVTFSPLNDALVDAIRPYLDPIIQPPKE